MGRPEKILPITLRTLRRIRNEIHLLFSPVLVTNDDEDIGKYFVWNKKYFLHVKNAHARTEALALQRKDTEGVARNLFSSNGIVKTKLTVISFAAREG